MKYFILISPLFFSLIFFSVNAQTSEQSFVETKTVPGENELKFQEQSARYINLRLNKMQELFAKQDKHIKKTLSRLAKKEKKLLNKYKGKDSLVNLQSRGDNGFDSIQRKYEVEKNNLKKSKRRNSTSKTLDSISVIKELAQRKLNIAKQTGSINTEFIPNTSSINIEDLQSQLAVQDDIKQHINQHGNQLKSAFSNIAGKNDLKSLNKELFYFKQKVQILKDLSNEPEKAEQLALEYLLGTKDFESAFNIGLSKKSTQGGLSMHDVKPEDLEKMGFQTKSSVQKQLSQKFNLNSPEKMEEFKDKTAKAKEEFNKLRDQKNKLGTDFKTLKEEGFQPNPLRGLPVNKRLEKSFNWQIRPASNGAPHVVDFAGQIGFKHTPRLTYNLLGGVAIGLGQSIRNVQLSYQGVRAGLNADWKWIWGISGQVGYEALFKNYTNSFVEQTEDGVAPVVISQEKLLKHTAYAGLMKTYKINEKYNGTLLVGYDFLWNKFNKQSPFIIRLGWKK